MARIKIELDSELIDGQPITFAAPCNCDEIEGLIVYHPNGHRSFDFTDAHGNALTGLGNLFARGAYVKAILDVTSGSAYLQNADTNAYLETRLAALGVEDVEHPGCFYRMVNGKQEWLNPPMELGVEYRTAERWLGMVVYTKLFDYGVIPKASEGVRTVIYTDSETNVEGIQVHYVTGRVGAINPSSGSTSLMHLKGIEFAFARGNKMHIKTNDSFDYNDPQYAYVEVKYVKLSVVD